VVDINSGSIKEPSHHHNITRSLTKTNLCDGKFKNYHKQSNGAENFVMISMLFLVEYGKIISYTGGF